MTGIIYALVHPITLETRYVGKTVRSLDVRLLQHIKDAKRKRTILHKWIGSLSHPPQITILDYDPVDLNEAEVYWIALLLENGARLLNGTKGGTGGAMVGEALEKMKKSRTGYKHTAATKKKISENSWSRTEEGKKQSSRVSREVWATQSEEQRQRRIDALVNGRRNSTYRTPKCLPGCSCGRHVSKKCKEGCECLRHQGGSTTESTLLGWETRRRNKLLKSSQ